MSQKTPTYLDAQLADKIQHEDVANAKRVINVDTLVNAYWNRVELTKDNKGGVTSADFYLDKNFQTTKIISVADVAGSLNNKYFLVNSALNKTLFYIWLNVDSGGSDPMIAGRTGVEVQISSGDSAEVIAVAIRIYINSLVGTYFTATSSGNSVTITNKIIGATDQAVDGNTGFVISTETFGESELLLSKTFDTVEGYKYIYNEATKSFELVSDCLNVDSANSTDTPLADGDIFYGPWTRRTCPEVLVAPYADTSFEYYVQFANTELSTTLGFPSYNAGSAAGIDSSLRFEYTSGTTLGTPRRLVFGREYYRVVVRNNSGSDMTALRLQTSLGTFDKLEVRLNNTLPLDSDAIVTRSIQTGLDPNNEYVNGRSGGYNEAFTIDTPMTNGQSITSEIQDMEGYAYLINEIASDVGLTLEGTWYDDLAGTNVIRTFIFPYTGGDLSLTATTMISQYLKYTITNNSGSDAAYTRVKVRTTNTSFQGQLLPIEAFVPPNSVANVTRSVLVGKRASDSIYQNVGVNDEGALQVSEFYGDVALGNYADSTIGTKFGRNPDIRIATTPEDIWNGGSTYTGMPITGTATTLQVVSTSSLDTSAGTGARTVRIFGLNSAYEPITEDITLNGTTAVTTVNSYWRQSRAVVLTAGSTGSNQGTISSSWTGTPAQIFMQMPIQANQTAIACDTIPAGKKRLILGIRASMARAGGTAGSANVRLLIRELGSVFQAKRSTEVTESLPYSVQLKGGILIPEKSDIKWQVFSVSDNATIVTAEFEYIDIDI